MQPFVPPRIAPTIPNAIGASGASRSLVSAPQAETKVIRFIVYDELGHDEIWNPHGNGLVHGDDAGSVTKDEVSLRD